MLVKMFRKFKKKLAKWIAYEPKRENEILPFDYNRLKQEVKPGDVLLVEGRSRVSNIIRYVTQSSWTHAALYIGRSIDIENKEVKRIIEEHSKFNANTPLIFEDLLDKGTTLQPLSKYQHHHMRICRPIGITPEDKNRVIIYCLASLGSKYNVRHLFDLFRFLLPWTWTVMPRRWRSSLFKRVDRRSKSSICSSRLAEAFASVRFPILPHVRIEEQKRIELVQRNPHLFTPKDFDTSPYFEIIKYPLFAPDRPIPYYRRLPWTKDNLIYDDHGVLSRTDSIEAQHHEKEPHEDDEPNEAK